MTSFGEVVLGCTQSNDDDDDDDDDGDDDNRITCAPLNICQAGRDKIALQVAFFA